MVQRKVPNKPGILAGGFKTEKLSANVTPSISYHDGKTKGADLRSKKMKRSRSFKRSDIDSCLRPSTKPHTAGKLLPYHCSTIPAATPQKQCPSKAPSCSPNYMKSTSSSDARKEKTQVCTRITTVICKTPIKRIASASKIHSAASHKQPKTFSKTSSLKKVRSLTKTPSFKPIRTSSVNNCSKVALCADLDAQRATCSSALKDSKFPPYLTLSPGATESEGTSIMKVCPYSYCSLNGHHHSPAPPLKCFLSARRRLLKTQRSMKQEAPLPCKAKPSDASAKELLITSRKPATPKVESPKDSGPMKCESNADKFIETYIKKQEYTTEADKESMNKRRNEAIYARDEKVAYPPEVMSSARVGEDAKMEPDHRQVTHSLLYEACSDTNFSQDSPPETLMKDSEAFILAPDLIAENREGQHETDSSACEHEHEHITDSLSDGSCSEMDFEDGLYRKFDTCSSDNDFNQISPEDALADNYLTKLAEERIHIECFWDGNHKESKTSLSHSLDELFAEASDMEWEEGQLSPSHLEIKDYHSTCSQTAQDKNLGHWDGQKNLDLQEESSLLPDDILRYSVEGFLFAEQQASYDEFSDGLFSDVGSLSDDIWQNIDANKSNQDYNSEGNSPKLRPRYYSNLILRTKLLDIDSTFAAADSTGISLACANCETKITANEDAHQELSPQFGDPETDTYLHSNTDERRLESTVTSTWSLVEEKEQDNEIKEPANVQRECEVDEMDKHSNISVPNQPAADGEISPHKYQYQLSNDGNPESPEFVGKESISFKNHQGTKNYIVLSSMVSEVISDSNMLGSCSNEDVGETVTAVEVEGIVNPGGAEALPYVNGETNSELDSISLHDDAKLDTGHPSTNSRSNKRQGCRGAVKDDEEPRKFNPREPNYLPVEPGPKAETVDLKPQDMDERKNAEEWMLDYALRQAVNKLAPARKRKVALLVEAFETVIPPSKCEPHSNRNAAGFARPLQTCS